MTSYSIDRRAARTQTALQDALKSLIRSKGYDAATVEGICETANIGRSTFYGHYANKDDLKRKGIDTIRHDLSHGAMENSGADKTSPGDCLGFSLILFEHAKDHVDLYSAMQGSSGAKLSLDAIHDIVSDMLLSGLSSRPNRRIETVVPDELLIRYLAGGYMALLTAWLEGGAVEPPFKMDEIFRKLVGGTLDPRVA
jgi:AcrR family transcriptional regulator